MKYTIEGFSQAVMVELGMDPVDAVILRWFVDFKDSGKMLFQIINGDVYYWIKYQQVVEDLPCIKIAKEALARRFKKMSDTGILDHLTVKTGGTFSYYKTGKQYIALIDSPSDLKVGGYDSKVGGGTILKSDPYDLKVVPNNSSIKDSSIKDNIEEKDDTIVSSKSFKMPTIVEVAEYCMEIGATISPEAFVDHYTGNGWMVGKVKMKDWRATVRNWQRKQPPKSEKKGYAENMAKENDKITAYRRFLDGEC